MRRIFCLVLGFLAITMAAAHAEFFSSANSDLQKALAAPGITIGDVELSHDELVTFYSARDNRLAWNFTGPENAATFSAFLDSIQNLVEYHGLIDEDYPVDLMRKLAEAPDDVSRLQLELLVTDTLIKLAHDLHGDSVDLADLYPGWNFHREDIDIPVLLQAAVSNNSLNEFIESLVPKNPTYRQLADTLKIYRAIAASGGWPTIDVGPILRPKDKSPRIEQIRARLAAEGYMPAVSLPSEQARIYDTDLQKVVAEYQIRNGFDGDGHIGDKTLQAMNKPVSARIDQIMANMERWRHMPDDFPPQRYTLVNIPSATVEITEDGKSVYRGIVIIGRVDRKTPFIQSNIRSMIVNPIWHVPTKIAQKDILPKLKQDPHYLEKLGFVIKGNESDPHGDNIDWQSMPEREFNFRLRQSPGDQNSLGRLKFDFDNDFAVYMHGTPHQELFKKDVRDLSSGCVRLRDPESVAQIFLEGNKEHWDIQRLEDEINSNKTHWVGIAKPMPLYILYWTVFTDESDHVNFRSDIYDYDSFLMQNMRSESKGDEPARMRPVTPRP